MYNTLSNNDSDLVHVIQGHTVMLYDLILYLATLEAGEIILSAHFHQMSTVVFTFSVQYWKVEIIKSRRKKRRALLPRPGKFGTGPQFSLR